MASLLYPRLHHLLLLLLPVSVFPVSHTQHIFVPLFPLYPRFHHLLLLPVLAFPVSHTQDSFVPLFPLYPRLHHLLLLPVSVFPVSHTQDISPPPSTLYLRQPHLLLPISVFILCQMVSHTQAISLCLFLYLIILLIQPTLTQQMKVIHGTACQLVTVYHSHHPHHIVSV